MAVQATAVILASSAQRGRAAPEAASATSAPSRRREDSRVVRVGTATTR